jgi:tape measure domain-containing protein
MNAIEWTFKMRDQMSAGVKNLASNWDKLANVAHHTLAVLDYSVAGAQAVGRAAVAAIQPAITKEKTLGAFQTMLGSTAAALDTYREAVKFANETPFATSEVVDSYKQLLAAQFKKEDLQTVVRIVGDAASLQEFPAEAMSSVNRALGQIASKGKLSQEELNQVAEAVPLNQQMFLQNLATLTGKSLEITRQMKEQGKISADIGIYATLQTLQQQFGGNMERASKQVGGLWSTIESLPETYLNRFLDTKGYTALRDALQKIVTVLDPASKMGQQFGQFFEELGSGVLDSIGNGIVWLVEGVSAFTEGLVSAIGPMDGLTSPTNAENMVLFRDVMSSTGSVVGGLISVMTTLVSWTGKFYGLMYDFGEWLNEHPVIASLLSGAGGAIAGGTAGLFTAGLPGAAVGLVAGGVAGLAAPTVADYMVSSAYETSPSVAPGISTQQLLLQQRDAQPWNTGLEMSGYSSGVEWGQQYEEGVRSALEIHSPSRVGQELGGYFEQGFQRGVGDLGLSEREESSTPAGAGTVMHMSVENHFYLQQGHDDSMLDEMQLRVESGIRQALERMGIQSGRRAYG